MFSSDNVPYLMCVGVRRISPCILNFQDLLKQTGYKNLKQILQS